MNLPQPPCNIRNARMQRAAMLLAGTLLLMPQAHAGYDFSNPAYVVHQRDDDPSLTSRSIASDDARERQEQQAQEDARARELARRDWMNRTAIEANPPAEFKYAGQQSDSDQPPARDHSEQTLNNIKANLGAREQAVDAEAQNIRAQERNNHTLFDRTAHFFLLMGIYALYDRYKNRGS